MIKRKLKAVMCHIGDMPVKEGIVCSDPCYDNGTWCSYTFDDGMAGEWSCYSTMAMSRVYGYSITALTLVRKGYEVKEATEKIVTKEIGVDSGTCGFFDKDYFEETHGEGKDTWYNLNILNSVLDGKMTHKLNNGGFWSQTLYGDGSYYLYADYDPADDSVIRLTVLYDWVKPEVLYVAENEEDAVFPYSCYNSEQKALRYLKAIGSVEDDVYHIMDNEYRSKKYVLVLPEPVSGILDAPELSSKNAFEVEKLLYYPDSGSVEVQGKYTCGSAVFDETFDFWQLDNGAKKKVVREIEKNPLIDKDKIFLKKDEKDTDNTGCSRKEFLEGRGRGR